MEQMKTRTTVLDRQIDKFDNYSDLEYASPKDLGSLVSKRQAKVSSTSSYKYNSLAVVRAVVLVAVIALLGFLLIYNIFAMAKVSSSITITEGLIASEQAEVNLLKEKLNALDSEAVLRDKAQSAGYTPNGGTVISSNTTLPTTDAITYDKQTNWFDKLCEILSSIFGG